VGPAEINLAFFFSLLLVAFFVGGAVERRHYRSIRARESRWARLPAVTLRSVPAGWEVTESGLLLGNVVVSVDYFKRFLAGLRGLVGAASTVMSRFSTAGAGRRCSG
jgi:hypothetical protein